MLIGRDTNRSEGWGLSIDGPAEFHDARRRTRRGGGTFDGAVRAVRLLQDQGLPFHVITVLTEHALDHPDRLFDFYNQSISKCTLRRHI